MVEACVGEDDDDAVDAEWPDAEEEEVTGAGTEDDVDETFVWDSSGCSGFLLNKEPNNDFFGFSPSELLLRRTADDGFKERPDVFGELAAVWLRLACECELDRLRVFAAGVGV